MGYWIPLEPLLNDCSLSEKWHVPPWEVRGLDPELYRSVYFQVEIIYSGVKAEFDYRERKEQERQSKRNSR